jgi:hypothetical protein
MRNSLLVPFLVCAAAAAADIPPLDSKRVAHQARIEGPKGFPAHQFFLYPVGHIPGPRSGGLAEGKATPVAEGQEVPFFKWVRPRLYAWAGTLPAPDLIDEQWIAQNKPAGSDVTIERFDYLPVSDPRARIQTTWRVTGVTADKVTVAREEVAFDHAGNLLEPKAASPLATPVPSPPAAAMSLPFGWVAAACALAGTLGIWFLSRRVR